MNNSFQKRTGQGPTLALLVTLLTLALSIQPCREVAAQVPGWPAGSPPPFVQGPTQGATLRNAAQATSVQVRLVRQTATAMGRRARSQGYQMQTFWADFQNLQFQFQGLRSTFGLAAQLVAQLQRPRADNAVAELDSGLNIIAEAFTPVQQEAQAGTVNRDTVLTMCRILDQALGVWENELKKDSSRLGMLR